MKLQKKIIKVLFLLVENYKNYGFLNFVKIIFFEIINILKFGYSDLFYDESNTKNSYKHTKKNIESKKTRYDATYLPTPYFFLEIIKNKIVNLNLSKFVFLDFGSGAGRVLNFFSSNFEELIGIDKDPKYRKYILKNNQKFVNLNIDNSENLKKIISKKKKFILYFFNPFDLFRITKIVNFFTSKNYKVLIITVNCATLKSKKIKRFYNKKFLKKNVGISIYKNF